MDLQREVTAVSRPAAEILSLCFSTLWAPQSRAGSYFIRSIELGGPYFHARKSGRGVLSALADGTGGGGARCVEVRHAERRSVCAALKIVTIASQDTAAYAYDDIAADPADRMPRPGAHVHAILHLAAACRALPRGLESVSGPGTGLLLRRRAIAMDYGA